MHFPVVCMPMCVCMKILCCAPSKSFGNGSNGFSLSFCAMNQFSLLRMIWLKPIGMGNDSILSVCTVESCRFRANNREFSVGMGNGAVLPFWIEERFSLPLLDAMCVSGKDLGT